MENRLNELEKKWDDRYARVLQDMAEETVSRYKTEEQIRTVIDANARRTRKTLARHKKSIDVATIIAIVALAVALASFVGMVRLSKTVTAALEQRELNEPIVIAAENLQEAGYEG